MSFRNKGTIGPTVIVSCEPDRSGNFVCDGTADDVQIQEAIDYVNVLGGGLVIIKPRVSGGSVLSYDITATITMYPYIGLRGATGGRSTELRLANGSNCDMILSAFASLHNLTSLLSSQTVVNVGGQGA